MGNLHAGSRGAAPVHAWWLSLVLVRALVDQLTCKSDIKVP